MPGPTVICAKTTNRKKAIDDYKQVLALCDDRPRDLVPTAAACLILQVDTQQDGFYYEVAAVGHADMHTVPTTWLLRKGFLLNFSDLVILADRVWTDINGKEYSILSAVIDSGGTRKRGAPEKHSRTTEVYQFCKANPKFIPLKGTGQKDHPVNWSVRDHWPGTNKPIPGGLRLATLNVHHFKTELARRLAVDKDAQGAFILYSGFTTDQIENPVAGIKPDTDLTDYAKHLCAEFKTDFGLWEHDTTAGRNDFHDCATYRMFQIWFLMQGDVLLPPDQSQQQQRPSPPQQPASGSSRPAWFNRR